MYSPIKEIKDFDGFATALGKVKNYYIDMLDQGKRVGKIELEYVIKAKKEAPKEIYPVIQENAHLTEASLETTKLDVTTEGSNALSSKDSKYYENVFKKRLEESKDVTVEKSRKIIVTAFDEALTVGERHKESPATLNAILLTMDGFGAVVNETTSNVISFLAPYSNQIFNKVLDAIEWIDKTISSSINSFSKVISSFSPW